MESKPRCSTAGILLRPKHGTLATLCPCYPWPLWAMGTDYWCIIYTLMSDLSHVSQSVSQPVRKKAANAIHKFYNSLLVKAIDHARNETVDWYMYMQLKYLLHASVQFSIWYMIILQAAFLPAFSLALITTIFILINAPCLITAPSHFFMGKGGKIHPKTAVGC